MSSWSWLVTTPAVSEPLSLADAKTHLRVTDSAEDALITAYIIAARKWIESHTNSLLPQQGVTANFDYFPRGTRTGMLLPGSPVEADPVVTYVDTSGDTQTLDNTNWIIDTHEVPAKLRLKYNKVWPSVRDQPNAVTLVYTGGYLNVPEDIIHALKLIVGSFYSQREAECPQKLYQPEMGVMRLLENYKQRYRGPF